ncbi:RING/U-box superfamily protein [Hirschfeldia incana]|nr:RING/U-box superfamily protein [Hirschfeldia incana]KAJ0256961.1 RING/U-box superfamily protein [Hirschfeldia incana]
MGSLCCVAAKSDRSDSASRDFSFGPHEPYWRTNTSFSPPPSSRWDVPGLTDGISFYGSSTSSSNANLLPSPDLSQTLHWNDFESATRRDQILKQQPGSSRNVGLGSYSDISDSEPNRNFSNRRFFMSKPVHPIHFGNARETISDSADACSWSSGTTSSIDSMEAVLDWDNHNSTKPQRAAASSTFRCGLCNRYISQKPPCGSRFIVRNRDMPVAGVLPCQHVFHAECLEKSTPKAHLSEPPCPVCTKEEGEQSKSHNLVLRLKPFCEDGPSTRRWGCAQVGDCVESAVNVPPRNTTMMMINRNRMRKNLSLRGSSSKDSQRRIKKSGSFAMENLSNQLSFLHSRGKEKV